LADTFKERQNIIRVFCILGALLLIGKAIHLQLIDRAYQDRAKTAAINKILLYPSRGIVYDRNDNILTYNYPSYDLMVTYNQLDSEMDTSYFCKILDISKDDFKKRLKKKWGKRYSKSVPFTFIRKLSAITYTKLQESLHEFPGFFVQIRNIRGYQDTIAAHMIGYVSEVNQEQISSSEGTYTLGDYIGSSGLEAAYEEELRGEKGMSFQLKDNLGRIVGDYKDGELNKAAVSGSDLITTIDKDLQTFGESLMKNKLGAVIAIEPSSGEILSFISSPTYNPEILAINRDRGKAFADLSEDPLNPFFNRAVAAKYPPGSLFKPIIGLIALQEGVWNYNSSFHCNEGYWNVDRMIGCHNHPTANNMGQAIQHSCNAYFCEVFKRIIDKEGYHNPDIGLNLLNSYLYKMGLGHPLGIDFEIEKDGNLPTTETYDKTYKGRRWRSPTIISNGIGQGEIELTTVQMANLAAIIANRGYFYTPHLVKAYKNKSDQIDLRFTQKNIVPIDSMNFEKILNGMEAVITSGTAMSSFVPDIRICGKTGTAQNPHGKDHSIFFAFAPRENPQIAIAVYVENAGDGGFVAAPIATLMIEKYINKFIAENRLAHQKQLENRVILPK